MTESKLSTTEIFKTETVRDLIARGTWPEAHLILQPVVPGCFFMNADALRKHKVTEVQLCSDADTRRER